MDAAGSFAGLRPVDTVAVTAPSSPVDRVRLLRGLEIIESWGFNLEVDDQVKGKTGYLAGDDSQRSRALARALTRPVVRCWWAARGGYGLQRILGDLPVPSDCTVGLMVGFSDVSAIHLAWVDSYPRPALLHAANATTLANLDGPSLEATRRAVAEGQPADFDRLEILKKGIAQGQVVAANWSILMSMVGTGLLPRMQGKVLVLEDVNEAPYRLDRMAWQLGHVARTWGLAGLGFGDLGGAEEDPQLRSELARLANQLHMPAVMGLPIGHGTKNMPVFCGMNVILDAAVGTMVFKQGA